MANVDDRFVNRISAARPEWEIHVLALNGWDTGDHLKFLEENTDYTTDRLVLIYVLNDISDVDPRSRSMRDELYRAAPSHYVLTYSYFFNQLYYRWLSWTSPTVLDYLQYQHEAYQGELWEVQRRRLLSTTSPCRGNWGPIDSGYLPLSPRPRILLSPSDDP